MKQTILPKIVNMVAHPMQVFVQRRNAIALEQARNHAAPVIAKVGAGNANASLNLPEDIGLPFCKGYFYARRMRPEGLDAPTIFYTETDSKGVPYIPLTSGKVVTLTWDNDSNPGKWVLDTSGSSST